MEHLIKILLLAGVVTLVPSQALPADPDLNYQKALSSAIHFYNQVHSTDNAFRLLEIYPASPNQDPEEQTPNFLSFTLKETVCPMAEDIDLDQCDFKVDGVEKECQGSISNEQDPAAIIITCDSVVPRSKRAPFFSRRKSSKKNQYKPGTYSVIAMGIPSIKKSPYMEAL